MALFNLGKNKEEENKKPVCACNGGCSTSESDKIENDCCNAAKDGICALRYLVLDVKAAMLYWKALKKQ